jgi:hypothetical protein
MLHRTKSGRLLRHRCQRGQTLLIFLAIIGVGFSALLYSSFGPASNSIERSKITNAALAQAKDALIGRAVSDANRPGSLPCPDNDNDGSAELYSGSDCPGYVPGSNVFIGRLPWRTLGLADLRDADGERLWYAVSRDFARNPTCAAGCPLNSDSLGQLTITGTSPGSNVVAVVFAPGYTLASQNRTTVAQQNTIANYLDASNANGDATFTTAAASNTFNDRLLVISAAELITVVERRVAREVRMILQNYKTATAVLGYNGGAGIYPWADCSDGTSDISLPPGSVSDGSNRGRIPWNNAVPVNWGSSGVAALPNWYVNNNWGWVIYYSVGKSFLQNFGAACGTCESIGTGSPPADGTLSVNGAFGKEVVIITSGPAGTSRPGGGHILGPWGDVIWSVGNCNPVGPTWQAWQAYLEDSQNNDVSNDRYVTPTSIAYARDRLYTIP